MQKTLLLAAVWQELDALVLQFLPTWDRQTAVFCFKNNEFHVKVVGIGMINAAFMAAHFLTKEEYDAVWMIGCCGTYCDFINIGDVIIATQEINGDLGIMEESGWKSPLDFPFSFLEQENKKYYHQFPCVVLSINSFVKSYRIHTGILLSCSLVSGSFAPAKILKERFSAFAENMEGAGVAQVALYFKKPFSEIRGVSNIAGERDKSKWDFTKAMRNCHEVFLNIK